MDKKYFEMFKGVKKYNKIIFLWCILLHPFYTVKTYFSFKGYLGIKNILEHVRAETKDVHKQIQSNNMDHKNSFKK